MTRQWVNKVAQLTVHCNERSCSHQDDLFIQINVWMRHRYSQGRFRISLSFQPFSPCLPTLSFSLVRTYIRQGPLSPCNRGFCSIFPSGGRSSPSGALQFGAHSSPCLMLGRCLRDPYLPDVWLLLLSDLSKVFGQSPSQRSLISRCFRADQAGIGTGPAWVYRGDEGRILH